MPRPKRSSTLKQSKVARAATQQMHDDVKFAVDCLLRTCTKHGLAVGGFVYGQTVPLFLYNFGNTLDASKPESYEKLCSLADAKRSAGDVVNLAPSRVQ